MSKSKKKILVIDDTKIVCLGLEAELGDAGWEVSSAYRGKDAVDKAKKEHFDLVFVDLMMPEMDGVETCRAIKEVSPETEVVLISGHPTEVEKKKDAFIAAGGRDGFLRKPFLEGEIVELTQKILEGKKQR